jgi:hypothetical protein
MIKSSDFKKLNDLYENCLECFDKICITKKTRREECASWSKTLELYYIIRNLKIDCEEFRTYQKKVKNIYNRFLSISKTKKFGPWL